MGQKRVVVGIISRDPHLGQSPCMITIMKLSKCHRRGRVSNDSTASSSSSVCHKTPLIKIGFCPLARSF